MSLILSPGTRGLTEKWAWCKIKLAKHQVEFTRQNTLFSPLDMDNMLTCALHDSSCKGYIPTSIVFVLRWQLSSTQVQCTYKASGFTYILCEFLIRMRYIWGPVSWLCNAFLRNISFGGWEIILNVLNVKCIHLLRYPPKGYQKPPEHKPTC